MDNIFTSQSVNFISAITPGVDPRTGLFSASASLGAITGNNGLGPELPLALIYSPLNQADTGFGKGVSLTLSSYDSQSGTLNISGGESHSVYEWDDGVTVRQQKLRTFTFEKTQNSYIITHKSGVQEFLSGPDYASSLKVPLQIRNACGHSIHLQWDMVNFDTPRLTSVRDDTNAILLSIYWSDTFASMNVWPGTPDAYSVTLRQGNGYLSRIENNADQGTPYIWTLEYSDVGYFGQWLTALTLPGGASQSVTYRTDGYAHQFPPAAGLPPLPYVTQLSARVSSDTQLQITDYDYTTENFLGYGSCQSWDNAQDNLYDTMTDYTYSSTETFLRDGETVTVKRTYNCYHLLTEERTTCQSSIHLISTCYFAKLWTEFDNQPDFFQLPQTRTVSWRNPDGSRDEVTTSRFDDYGNLLYQQMPDGSTATLDYFPAEGISGLCPPDPGGFVRYLRQKTITPATKDIASYPDVIPPATQHTWTSLTTASGRPVVMELQDKVSAGNNLLTQTDYSYDASAAWCGRLMEKKITLFHQGTAAGVRRETFAVTPGTHTLNYEHTRHTHDGLSQTETRQYSRWSHRLLEHCNAQALTTRNQWDSQGRPVRSTMNAGTQYENHGQATYGVSGHSGAAFFVQHTDPLNNQSRTHVDAHGHILMKEICNANRPELWVIVQTAEYDVWGRPVQVSSLDEETDGSGKNYSLSHDTHYDVWGQACRIVSSDGTVSVTTHNPVTQQTESYVTDINNTLRSARKIIRFSVSGQVLSEQHVDENNKQLSCRNYIYDGLYRLRSVSETVSDTECNITKHSYDDFGRDVETVLPDGVSVTRLYAPFSVAALQTRISVDGACLGTQEFDGLDRLTAFESGGRRYQYQYNSSASLKPETVITPDGQKVSHTYIPALNSAISRAQVGNIVQTFTYNPVTGALLEHQEGHHRTVMSYDAAGLLVSVEDYRAGLRVQCLQYAHTAQGMVSRETDVLKGISVIPERDRCGRLISTHDGGIMTTLTYDTLGRVTGYALQDGQGYKGTTTLVLDALGRETERRFTGPGLSTCQRMQWDQNGQVISCQDNNATETYGYDVRNRLVHYTCNANYRQHLPQDERGRPFTEQQFGWDALNNMTYARTMFEETGQYSDAVYQYGNKADPTQLTYVHYSHTDPGRYNQDLALTYDAAGRLLTDGQGRELEWDSLGRFSTAKCPRRLPGEYGYNALNQMVSLPDAQQRLYAGAMLREVQDADNNSSRFIHANGQKMAQATGDSAGFYATDPKGSVTGLSQKGSTRFDRRFTPFGGLGGNLDAEPQDPSLVSFCGEATDALTGLYHPGNGYRPYSPSLMRFIAPDSMSPFGAGGINTYAYCSGDPINHIDPTGHFNWGLFGKILGYVGLGVAAIGLIVATGGMISGVVAAGAVSLSALGGASAVAVTAADVVSLGMGIASEVVHDPTLSLGLGIASAVTGLAGLVKEVPAVIRSGQKTLSAARKLAGLRGIKLSGRGEVSANLTVDSKVGKATLYFDDTRPSLNLWAHGAPFLTESDKLRSGTKFADQIVERINIIHEQGVIAHRPQFIDFISCYSATGGRYSQAQILANKTQIKVFGYLGKVNDSGLDNPLANQARSFLPMASASQMHRVEILNTVFSKMSRGYVVPGRFMQGLFRSAAEVEA